MFFNGKNNNGGNIYYKYKVYFYFFIACFFTFILFDFLFNTLFKESESLDTFYSYTKQLKTYSETKNSSFILFKFFTNTDYRIFVYNSFINDIIQDYIFIYFIFYLIFIFIMWYLFFKNYKKII